MAPISEDMYRIGEYSRFMGVSTDLLKHYERRGLIRATTEENGYRYYHFHQSTRLLECMRLRNYGLSLSGMQELLDSLPYEQTQQRLDEQIDAMEDMLRFQTQVIAEHRRISAWMSGMRGRETRVTEDEQPAMLFLPQSRNRQFLKDERIAALLESWVAAMPIVKSCRYFADILAQDAVDQAMWGLAVTEEDAQALSLPVNDAVIRIEGGPALQVHSHHTLEHKPGAKRPFHDVARLLQESGRALRGPALQLMLMTLACSDQSHEACCVFTVPLGGA